HLDGRCDESWCFSNKSEKHRSQRDDESHMGKTAEGQCVWKVGSSLEGASLHDPQRLQGPSFKPDGGIVALRLEKPADIVNVWCKPDPATKSPDSLAVIRVVSWLLFR